MSDNEGHEIGVTFKQFVDFLHDVKATQPCTACGQKGWVVLTGEPDQMVKIELNGADGRGLSVYSSYCANCGMVRSHAAPILVQWIKDKASKDANRVEDDPEGGEIE